MTTECTITTNSESGLNVWKGLKWRRLASFFMVFGSIVLLVSGLVLYFAPSGRVAHSLDWQIIGLDRWQWDAIHTVFGFAWILFALIHVFFNWSAILCYLKKGVNGARSYGITPELVIALLLTLLIWVGTIWNVPPFSTIVGLGH